MNASDDRSPAQFKEHIENATNMSGVLDQYQRPNCLVIDEIDGAGAPAIQVYIYKASVMQSIFTKQNYGRHLQFFI